MAVGGLKCILHAEDDPNDQFLFRRACEMTGLDYVVQTVHDGQEAIHYLEAAAERSEPLRFPMPSLLVSDLKMPRLDGLEVLAWIRRHAVLKPLPVMMFSSSSMPADVATGYKLGANAYLSKPADYNELVKVARFIKLWLELCAPALAAEGV